MRHDIRTQKQLMDWPSIYWSSACQLPCPSERLPPAFVGKESNGIFQLISAGSKAELLPILACNVARETANIATSPVVNSTR